MRTKPAYLTISLTGMILACLSCTDEPVTNVDPVCRIVSPVDGEEVQAGDTVTIIAEAVDEDDRIADVLFFFGGSPIGSASLSPYTFKYVPTPDQDGYQSIRATALDAQGGQASDEITVQVVINLPIVQTLEPHLDEQDRLVLGGVVSGDGGSEVTSRGVCWSTDPDPDIEDEHTCVGAGTGSFTCTVSGLEIGKTYYIRAFASNSTGTSYGSQLTYRLVTKPVVRTEPVSDLTNITVVFTGTVINDGGDSIVALGFIWGTQPALDTNDNHLPAAAGSGAFSYRLTGLSVSSSYYYRAYATNSKGTAYGEEIQFTTLSLEFGSVLDDRDKRIYSTVEIADQWWMSENLNAGVFVKSTPSSGESDDLLDNGIIEKYCYDNNPGLCDQFGGLYTWDEMMQYEPSDKGKIGTVQGVCPSGWHLPTEKEWRRLEINLGMSPAEAKEPGIRGSQEGTRIKEKEGNHWLITDPTIADEVAFHALPAGIRLIDGGFDALGAVTSFWSSTMIEEGSAWNRHLTDEFTGILKGEGAHNEGFSVRCVKD